VYPDAEPNTQEWKKSCHKKKKKKYGIQQRV
jgi:hypothetical protein